MECFYHPDTSAVGVCKHCQKGLCHECAVDLGFALVCQGSCEERVRQIEKMVEGGVRLQQNVGSAQKLQAVLLASLGLSVLTFGVFSGEPIFFRFFVPLGIVVLLGSALAYWNYRRTNLSK